MTTKQPNLSIIIPAYNEAGRLPGTLEHILKFTQTFEPDCEILIVDDGSHDQTCQEAARFITTHPSAHMRVLRHAKNLGKGAAVRTGMTAAAGKVVVYIDADNSLPIENLAEIIPLLSETDIVITSKYLRPSQDTNRQELGRTIIARGGNFLSRYLFGLPYSDTQCGLKALRGSAARIIAQRMQINRWAFDIELLFIAKKMNLQVVEVPITWHDTDDSRVSALPAALTSLVELVQIFVNNLFGRYR